MGLHILQMNEADLSQLAVGGFILHNQRARELSLDSLFLAKQDVLVNSKHDMSLIYVTI